MPPEERVAKSQVIAAQLETVLDWTLVNNVHAFEPILSLGEVDISPFVRLLACPVSYPAKRNGEWVMGAEAYDVIIVPMLGFDASLHRLGYGGGFYDKFLAAQPQARMIGVCFELGKVDQLPVESHDISLNLVVTEAAVYRD